MRWFGRGSQTCAKLKLYDRNNMVFGETIPTIFDHFKGKITHLYSLDMIFTKIFDKIRNLQKYSNIP